MGPCTYFHHRRPINNIFSWSSSRWTKDPSTAVASPLSYHSELQLYGFPYFLIIITAVKCVLFIFEAFLGMLLEEVFLGYEYFSSLQGA